MYCILEGCVGCPASRASVALQASSTHSSTGSATWEHADSQQTLCMRNEVDGNRPMAKNGSLTAALARQLRWHQPLHSSSATRA